MTKEKLIFELGLLFVSVYYSFSSLLMPRGTVSQPGPGFFPLILGILAILLAIPLIINSIISCKNNKIDNKEDTAGNKSDKMGLFRVVGYILALLVSMFLFEFLGAIISVFVLTLVLSKIAGQKGWLVPFILGLCCSVGVYVIFNILFDIYLPEGLLSFVF